MNSIDFDALTKSLCVSEEISEQFPNVRIQEIRDILVWNIFLSGTQLSAHYVQIEFANEMKKVKADIVTPKGETIWSRSCLTVNIRKLLKLAGVQFGIMVPKKG